MRAVRESTTAGYRPTLRLLALAALLCAAAPAAGQKPPPSVPKDDSVIVYRREVFRYSGGSRADPFRSLLGSSDVGVRVEDLSLRGVVYHPDPSRSVAVLARVGTERPLRAHVGDRIGGIRVLAIRPRSVDLMVEEFGIARRATLEITRATPTAKN
jgi:hypothetical protein